jgi:hypothetical protein
MEFDLARGHRIRARRGHATHPCGATRLWNALARGRASVERLVAAATSGSPVLKHGPMPPAAEEGVNALSFWNAGARGDASVERGGAGPRECGTLDAAATSGSPVLKHGPMPPAAEEGVNALGFWNEVARGDASVERGGAGRRECGTRWRRGRSNETQPNTDRLVWLLSAQLLDGLHGPGRDVRRPWKAPWKAIV